MIDFRKDQVTADHLVVTADGDDVFVTILVQHQIKLYDVNGTFLSNLENITTKAVWDWNRIGGCGAAQFTFREDWDGVIAGSFTESAELRVVMRDENNNDVVWYSGSIDRVIPTVDGNRESINVLALGFVNKLKKYVVKDQIYSGNEISVTAKTVVDTFVVPNTPITTIDADFEDTDFSANRLDFNESAHDVMLKLAATAGKTEWGVRADKSFFFKRRDDTNKHFFHITEDFSSYRPIKDFNPIVTRIYLQGGRGYNSRFTLSNKTVLNEEIVQNASISTQSVGQQFARVFLKDRGKAKRSYVATIPNKEQRFEDTIPLGRATVNVKIGINIKYDVADQKYDSGLKYDGGTETFQIERIRYELKDEKMNTILFFGSVPPVLSDELTRLETQIINERNV